MKRFRPSPSMAVALLALFVALSGTAVAAGIVPLARRAFNADQAKNAAKLQGRTPAQVAALASPSVAAKVSIASADWKLNVGEANAFVATCQAGQKVVSGGYEALAGDALQFDLDAPGSDGASWKVSLLNFSDTAVASGKVYAICVS